MGLSLLLTDDLKKVYDISTNQMLRTKLYQLKNQNQNLGMTSGEVMKCALPEDCSDRVLLEYPGFDKIWAKHIENLDWYPKFEWLLQMGKDLVINNRHYITIIP